MRLNTAAKAFIRVVYATAAIILTYYLVRAIQANRTLGLVFDVFLTIGLAAFIGYGLYDSYKVLREVDRKWSREKR